MLHKVMHSLIGIVLHICLDIFHLYIWPPASIIFPPPSQDTTPAILHTIHTPVYQVFKKSHRQAKSKQIWSKIPSTTHCTTPLLNPWSVNPWVLALSISLKRLHTNISPLRSRTPRSSTPKKNPRRYREPCFYSPKHPNGRRINRIRHEYGQIHGV